MRCWLVIKRNELGLTQEEVAKKAAIARTTYAMIEQDNRKPSVNVAKRLSKVLGIDWTLFFEEKCHELCNTSEIKHA
ncbi:helix-turn-helix transcriptional regulator [Brevibacillus sp. NL20B1]|jgi:putative transcriptional regulator|uniref:helix-turn-helix transcriptional regulator n=1 Tax=Brevibacillus sp. NL20B1 TaxID=2829799 RepID=UPI001BA3A091|nr:helix-turn-helix transcriptional regulator [Brevibacillus sp. NL20B1]MBR8660725.1 helix-turn-helix transcriptional regulator [Brevibacillus sp. NL20B1]